MINKIKKIFSMYKDYKIIKQSGLFDEKFYIFEYEDIRKADIDPLWHYIKTGWREGRKPNRDFDTKYYVDKYEDVKAANINPLLHYILYGKKEGRETKSFTKIIVEDKNGRKIFTKKDAYQTWLEVNELNKRKIEYLKNLLRNIEYRPKFSIILPTYNPELKFLSKAVDSVLNQIYDNWEICISDDASTKTYVKPFLKKLSQNKKIKVRFNSKNVHISENTNRAVEIADGEYLVFLDQDDELTPDALAEFVLFLNEKGEHDIIYSDDDKIDTKGKRFAPQFKPEYSPHYLLSFMYCSHLKCVKKDFFEKLGGFRKGFEGSQDYDFYLRASEKTKKFGHIPKILYHWRVVEGSTAAGGGEKHYSFEAGVKALQEAVDRRGINAKAYHPDWALKNGNGIYALEFPDEGEDVAIIIPTKNGYELIKTCVESVLEKTTYKNYKIYIIDNDSDDEKTLEYLANLEKENKAKILKISSPNGKFSYAYINNRAVEMVNEKYVLFLNNDTKVINPKWLSQMLGYLQFKDVGSVGARLLFGDDRIQHAGIIHGIDHGFPVTSGRLLPRWNWGYMASTVTSKDFAAVTAACMLTPRELFLNMGGFDEKDFAVAFNDCDYGYRLHKAGYRNILAPEAELYHYEGLTRGHGDRPEEEANYIQKYGKWKDPYYNPNFAKGRETYKIDSKVVVLHKIPKFKILMVTHNLNLEGAPRSCYEIAKGLHKKENIEVTVVSYQEGHLRELYEKEGIKVQILPRYRLLNITDKEMIESDMDELKEYVKNLNPDVIYGNTLQTFWISHIGKKLNIPSVWNIRESETPPFSAFHNVLRPYLQEAMIYPYRVVFVADATRKIYEPFNISNNFITVYNGFDEKYVLDKIKGLKREDIRKSLGISDDEVVYLNVGTVCERKSQKDFIKAISLLDNADGMKFVIVGDRKTLEYSQEMHKMIEELPAEKREKIMIIDETMDVHKYYLMSDVFVFNSRVESFPKVIQEAMFFGLAIITTPVFGVKEQVRDKISALFYKPGDIKTLAKHIKTLKDDEKLRKTLAKNAKLSLKRLPSMEDMVNDYYEIFQEAWLCGKSR